MSIERIAIIALGAVGMLVLMLLRRKMYPEVAPWKMVPLSLLLTVTGVLGTMLMYFVESGKFGGTSFFGAVLFVPILMLPALVLKLSYKTIMDLCGPAECLMLAVMKLDCLENGCCIGKYLPGLGFQFPSQIVEMIAALAVMAVLLKIESRKKGEHLYAWYLVLYGSVRFALNWFRYGQKPFLLGLPNGNFWGLISVVVGVAWILGAKAVRTGDAKKKV